MTKELMLIIEKGIDAHRELSFLTCPETCWCWDAENEVNSWMEMQNIQRDEVKK